MFSETQKFSESTQWTSLDFFRGTHTNISSAEGESFVGACNLGNFEI